MDHNLTLILTICNEIKITILIALLVIVTACAEMQKVLQTTGPVPLTEADVVQRIKGGTYHRGKKFRRRYWVPKMVILVMQLLKFSFLMMQKLLLIIFQKYRAVINLSRMWCSGSTGLLRMLLKRQHLFLPAAVKQMTIKDAFNILNGADNAATQYLRQTTYNELYALYKPKITASTEKKIVGIGFDKRIVGCSYRQME